ncbi:hypothetical protein SAMN05443244_2742 [Terriglobus roseus]|uniref:Uncharacterized protein n=1 Tax=Terriglobus roseus TaxID=392734 RepID=A0A1H4Q1Q3_9BACT|nr:hypothetical protein SAMN05443244_2742 [Terriglobus roseus]
MTASLQLPEILYSKIVEVAKAQSLSVDEFMILAAAEKLASLQHHEWLTGKAEPGPQNPCGAA